MKRLAIEEAKKILSQLKSKKADDLENQHLEIKPWKDSRTSQQVAIEYATCLANAGGGAILFGVADDKIGEEAIHGCSNYCIDTIKTAIYQGTKPPIHVEIEEVHVRQGMGNVLLINVEKAQNGISHGTAKGLFQKRVGKNCMPMHPEDIFKHKVASGVLDWGGEVNSNATMESVDPINVEIARRFLRRARSDSPLLKGGDREFLISLGVLRGNRLTNAGCILFCKEAMLQAGYPQHQVRYVFQSSETKVARNDAYRSGLMDIVKRLEEMFSGPNNPEYEVQLGLVKVRIPMFDLESVREGILNAITHRDYANPNDVLVRHTEKELQITSPGGFIGGITPNNILRHEPITRNRSLAEVFQKLGLVERAGIGRNRIFSFSLRYGKRMPEYSADTEHVTLRMFNDPIDQRTTALISRWHEEGKIIPLDGLIIINALRTNRSLDINAVRRLLQYQSDDEARNRVNELIDAYGILEKRGRFKGTSYHLPKGIAVELIGKAAYSKDRGIQEARYREMIRQYLMDHGEITPMQARDLLGLGSTASAKSAMSRYLREWSSGRQGFLRKHGTKPRNKYSLRIHRRGR